MKIFQSSIFRALTAIVVGALLVKYPEQDVTQANSPLPIRRDASSVAANLHFPLWAQEA